MIPFLLVSLFSGQPVHGVWVAKGYPGDWEEAASVLHSAGVDHVLPCFLYGVTPAYLSDIVPDSPGFPADPEWVESILTECGMRGIEVHAWVVLWKLTHADSSLLDSLSGEGMLQVNLTGDTLPWLCPTDPASIELETALVLEMLERFPLDGVQFDYIRFPNDRSCYCEGCRARFQEETGLSAGSWPDDVAPGGSLRDRYSAWRVRRITYALIVLSEAVRQRGIPVSVAVFPDCRDALGYGQDWVDWSRRGIVDRIYPMNYFRTTLELEEALAGQIPLLPRGFPLLSGLGSGIGSLEVTSVEAASQIEAALRSGASGVCHFHLNETLLQALPVIRGLRAVPER